MAITPGPWSRNIRPAKKYPTVFAGQNTHVAIVVTANLSDEEIEANCDLIAAAPELLAALETISQIQRDKCETASAEMLFMVLDHKVGIATAAIAKATAA